VVRAPSALFHPLLPSPMPARGAYDAGRAPMRAPFHAPAALGAPGTPAAAGLHILLIESGSDVSEIQSALLSFPEIAQVDVFDGGSAVPTLAFLRDYNTVFTIANVPYGDPFALGNVLADYVDAGGGVVLTLATFINGWQITGRLLTDGYFPFELGSGPVGSSSLGSYNAAHPIMQGVTAVAGDLLGQVNVAAGADLVASWANGLPLVATKGFRVAAVNLFFGASGFWNGDVPRLMRNAAFWAGGT